MTETTGATASVTTPASTPTPDWFGTLTPELQAEKSLESFKGKPVTEVVKSYVEAQKMIGGSIRLPKPDATPEERKKFTNDILAKLGRPDSPDKYAVTKPAVPDGIPWDDNAHKAFVGKAHELGLLPEQVQGVLDWYGANLVAGTQAQQKALADGMATLRTEWGQDYDGKYAQAINLVQKYGGDELISELELRGKANSPRLLKFLAAIGEAFGEPKMIRGDARTVAGQDEARAKIAEINANKQHPYWKGDPAAVAEMSELFRKAAGPDAGKVVVQRN